jgi:hypothetical protein
MKTKKLTHKEITDAYKRLSKRATGAHLTFIKIATFELLCAIQDPKLN